MSVLTDAQYDRLAEMLWVMYVTEDGEEYYGKVGSDFTQWDPPEELSEEDIALLRLSMAELGEEESELTVNSDGDGADAEPVSGAENGVGGGKDEERGMEPSPEPRGDDEETVGQGSQGPKEDNEEVADATELPAKDAAPSAAGTTRASSPLDASISPSSRHSQKARFMSSAARASGSSAALSSSAGPTVNQNPKSLGTKKRSFHKVPTGARPMLHRGTSKHDIKAARQGTGRTVDALAPPNRAPAHGMRAMFMTLSDPEIRGVLVEMGDREGAMHLKSRDQLVDAIFNRNPSQKEIMDRLAEVQIARANKGAKNESASRAAEPQKTSRNKGRRTSMFSMGRPISLGAKKSGSTALLRMSSLKKSSVGAGMVGIPSAKTWSAEAVAAAEALSAVARTVLSGSADSRIDDEQLNIRSAIPEFVSKDVDVVSLRGGKKFVLKILFPPQDVHNKRIPSPTTPGSGAGGDKRMSSSQSSGEGGGGGESKFRPTTPTQPAESEYDGADLPLPDKKGWLKKRGHTTHVLTSDYKNRWFELNAIESELTYYGEQIPDAVMGDGAQNEEVEEAKRKNIKGTVDLSIVHELRPSKARRAPKMAFDLETESRTWIIVPPSASEQKSWLTLLCKIVKREAVSKEYQDYIDAPVVTSTGGAPSPPPGKHGKHRASRTSSTYGVAGGQTLHATEVSYVTVACDPSTSTVRSVLQDAFSNFRRRCHKELDEKGPGACALKVTGLREFLATPDRLMITYTHIQEAVKEPGQIELQLVHSQVLETLVGKARKLLADEKSTPAASAVEAAASPEDSASGFSTDRDVVDMPSRAREDRSSSPRDWAELRRSSSVLSTQGSWAKFVEPESGDPFWYNAGTDESQWEEPIGWALDAKDEEQGPADFFERALAKHCGDNRSGFSEETYSFMDKDSMIESLAETSSRSEHSDAPVATAAVTTWGRRKSTSTKANMVISKRGARWPLRVRVECLEGLVCSEIKHVNKEDQIFPIPDIVKVMVRLRIMVGGEPVLGGRMQTVPVPFKNNMRFVHGFSEHIGKWLSTKLAIASLPSRSRLFIEVVGERQDPSADQSDIVLASASLQLCDHTGRMVSGRRAIKLWPRVEVNPISVEHTCPTPWSSFKEVSEMLKVPVSEVRDGAFAVGSSDGAADGGPLESGVSTPIRPTLYLRFDEFEAPIVWRPSISRSDMRGPAAEPETHGTSGPPMTGASRGRYSSSDGFLTKTLLAINSYNVGLGGRGGGAQGGLKSSFMPSLYGIDDMDNEEDLDIEKSGFLEFEKKKTTFGRAKWRGPFWFVLQEVTGKLSWYDSKRADAKLLGQQDLAGVNVEFCPAKNRTYKQGKGSTLKDVETCCFSVEIRKAEPPFAVKTTLYLAHKSRREARAWMDAIAKVGLIQSEMILEDEMYGAGAGREMEFGGVQLPTYLKGRTASTDSSGSMRKSTAGSRRARKSVAVNGLRKGRVSIMSHAGSESSRSRSFSQDGEPGSGSEGLERGTGMGGVDLYHLATGRSVWFDHLESVIQEATPIRALRRRVLGGETCSELEKRPIVGGFGAEGSPSIPLGMIFLDPVLAVRFGRRLTDVQRGLMLVWAIYRLVHARKRLRRPFASARDHLSRFRAISSKRKVGVPSASSDPPKAPSTSASLPPPPDDIYVPDGVAADIQEALASVDISSSAGLERAHVAAAEALRKPFLEFVPEVSRHWATALSVPEKSPSTTADTSPSNDPWYFWQRARYVSWWMAPSSHDGHSHHDKLVNLLTLATSLREHSVKKASKAGPKNSLCERFTLAQTCEYVASTMFQLGTNSTAAVDFLHYKVGDSADGSFILPSGADFDFTAQMGNLSIRHALSTIERAAAEAPESQPSDQAAGAHASDHILSMLDPLWFEGIRCDGPLCDALWNKVLEQAFGSGGEASSSAGVMGTLSLPVTDNAASAAGETTAGGNSRGLVESEDTSWVSSRSVSGSSATEGSSPTRDGLGKGTSVRHRRGSTRDPLVFLRDEEAVSRVINADPLHELSANEKAMLWRHRRRLAERYKFKALPKLLRAVNWFSRHERRSMLELLKDWPRPEPDAATSILELLDEAFHEPDVREFATLGLNALSDQVLASCIPQLVQAIKYEPYHSSNLAKFLIRRALLSPLLIGLPFFWCCKVELRGAHCSERYGILISCYLKFCGPVQRALVDQQAHLWSETGAFAAVAAAVYACKGQGKKKYVTVLREHLTMLQRSLPAEFSLPIDPRIICRGVKVEKCRVMSSAKLPLWLVFENADPLGEDIMVMFKAGDDLRQDTMVLQLIRNMDAMWRAAGLDLCMLPYRCVATWHDGGMLEIVKNSATTADIQTRYGGKYGGAFKSDVFEMWLRDNNSTKHSKSTKKSKGKGKDLKLEEARRRFMLSCAGYCVATHVMGIGDRHNDNIMIKKDGRYFHIDFGHFLGNFKYMGGVRRERTSFVFTNEMCHVLGGKKSVLFEEFVTTCTDALFVLYSQGPALVNMFTLMVPAGMPELSKREDILYLRDKVYCDTERDEMMTTLRTEIDRGLSSLMKKADNFFHIIKHA